MVVVRREDDVTVVVGWLRRRLFSGVAGDNDPASAVVDGGAIRVPGGPVLRRAKTVRNNE